MGNDSCDALALIAVGALVVTFTFLRGEPFIGAPPDIATSKEPVPKLRCHLVAPGKRDHPRGRFERILARNNGRVNELEAEKRAVPSRISRSGSTRDEM